MPGKKGSAKKKAQKKASNVFSMFEQSQIQEFKEAFNMIDQNRDGFIDEADLNDLFASLGKDQDSAYIEGMVKEAPGPINFTCFLTLFGEKLNGTDAEDVILNAFKCFDPDGKGTIAEAEIRQMLLTQGDRFTQEEVDETFASAPVDDAGQFDYVEFTKIVKHGDKEEE